MARELARFDLHEWHNDHDAAARFPIGGSGIPRADLTPFLPKTAQEWEDLWATPPNDAIDEIKRLLRKAYRFEPDEILLTEGASEADFVAALALAPPGSEVLVEEPAYFALLEPARALGCKVVRARRDPANGFALHADQVVKAIHRNTRLVVLARPNNPTGERVPDADLQRIAEAAERVDAHVLVDEVFAEATKAGDTPARRLHDRILSVNSITKCLGFGPMHIGWVAGASAVVERIHRAKAHTRPLNPILSLTLAARVLRSRETLLATTRERRAKNAATLRKFLSDRSSLGWHLHEHGTTTVVRLPGPRADDVAFAKRLLTAEGVLVAPGSYLELPGYIRIGLLAPPDVLRAGLDGLARALRA